MQNDWIQNFPDLASLPVTDQEMLCDRASPISLPAGTTVFAPGHRAESFLLVLEGVVRVQQVSSSGREIILYRVTGGEACIMTTACLLSDETYSAEGITETDVQAVAISKSAFDEAITRSAGFRRAVFSDYSHRISDLMHVVEEVAFERLDKRLAQCLLKRVNQSGFVTATHQELAAEIGSAREVIGRNLKEMERRGLVALSRGQVQVMERARLEHMAQD